MSRCKLLGEEYQSFLLQQENNTLLEYFLTCLGILILKSKRHTEPIVFTVRNVLLE